MNDLFEFKLGSMAIDKYKRRFLELLKYVAFIKDEQVKIQRYLSEFPSFISDKIQYDDPKTLEETIRHTKCLYEKKRGRGTFQKAWEDKMKSKVEQRKKGAKPPFFRNTTQGKKTLKELILSKIVEWRPRKQPIQCWGCGRNHVFRYCAQRGEKSKTVHNV
jgi:hypothetical protein